MWQNFIISGWREKCHGHTTMICQPSIRTNFETVGKSRPIKKKIIIEFYKSSGIVQRIVLDTQKTLTDKCSAA